MATVTRNSRDLPAVNASATQTLLFNRLSLRTLNTSVSSQSDRSYLRREWTCAVAAWAKQLGGHQYNSPQTFDIRGWSVPPLALRSALESSGIKTPDWNTVRKNETSKVTSEPIYELRLDDRIVRFNAIHTEADRQSTRILARASTPLDCVCFIDDLLFCANSTDRVTLIPDGFSEKLKLVRQVLGLRWGVFYVDLQSQSLWSVLPYFPDSISAKYQTFIEGAILSIVMDFLN